MWFPVFGFENILKIHKMSFFTYILYSDSKDRYYIGSTEDIHFRLARHNAGATPSTKAGRPWRIVYTEEFQTKTDALVCENDIKKMKNRKYIETLIGKGSPAG